MSAEENAQQPPSGCERVAATYAALREGPSNEKYAALLRALEADLAEGRVMFFPVSRKDVEDIQAGGQLKLMALKTSSGDMLAAFTSPGEAGRNGAEGSLAVPLGVLFQTLLQNRQFSGIILNPFDRNGVAVQREHAQQVFENVRRKVQRLDQPLVVEALWHLWDVAEGVPFAYRDVREEVAALGGVDRLMGPVMAEWKRRFDAGELKDRAPRDLMRDIASDVLRHALAAAVVVQANPHVFDEKTPFEWFREDVVEEDGESLEQEVWLCLDRDDPPAEKVAELQGAVARNVDAYIRILGENLKRKGLVKTDEEIGPSMLANAAPVCFGAMSFGVGWGMALHCEKQGGDVLRAARARQESLLAPGADSGKNEPR